MSGGAAIESATASPRVLVLDGDEAHDVFEVLGISNGVARVRSPLLFEIGEELGVRVEQDGKSTETTARVRAHIGPVDARVTELELTTA
jgi:hypothetical protein